MKLSIWDTAGQERFRTITAGKSGPSVQIAMFCLVVLSVFSTLLYSKLTSFVVFPDCFSQPTTVERTVSCLYTTLQTNRHLTVRVLPVRLGHSCGIVNGIVNVAFALARISYRCLFLSPSVC